MNDDNSKDRLAATGLPQGDLVESTNEPPTEAQYAVVETWLNAFLGTASGMFDTPVDAMIAVHAAIMATLVEIVPNRVGKHCMIVAQEAARIITASETSSPQASASVIDLSAERKQKMH
jgi:hypothetical protein